jgi:hypothetical protein
MIASSYRYRAEPPTAHHAPIRYQFSNRLLSMSIKRSSRSLCQGYAGTDQTGHVTPLPFLPRKAPE